MTTRTIAALLTALGLCGATAIAGEGGPEAEIVEVRKIWDKAPHSAFTDLVRYENSWYCTFREGEGHVSPDSAIRVITSKDGATWKSAARLASPSAELSDIRDPKLAIAPDGRLMLNAASAKPGTRMNKIWYSKNGSDWGEAIPIGPQDPQQDYWIWRVTWHNGTAYGVGYRYTPNDDHPYGTRLYQSTDGTHFEVLVPSLLSQNSPNESSLLFLPDDTAYCVTRREGPDTTTMLGTARPPYTQWSWQDLGVRIGGPAILRLEDGRIVVGGRDYPGGAKMQLWWLDPGAATLTPIIALPSGGDTSYPGLVEYNGLLWVSYYSSHDGKTSIYLAKVDLPPAE